MLYLQMQALDRGSFTCSAGALLLPPSHVIFQANELSHYSTSVLQKGSRCCALLGCKSKDHPNTRNKLLLFSNLPALHSFLQQNWGFHCM